MCYMNNIYSNNWFTNEEYCWTESTWGIAVCDNGDIVVAESKSITIVNKEGKKARSFQSVRSFGTKEIQFTRPRGVAITNDKHILVTDEHRLQKLTFDGDCVQSVGSSESGSGQLQLNSPRGMQFILLEE